MKILIISAFVLLVLAQWLVPGEMIFEKAKILSNGRPLKFQTAPVDPYDQFRGKYIYLKFKEDHFTRAGDKTKNAVSFNGEVYVSFKLDEKGFAHVDKLSEKPFSGNIPYVKATVFPQYIEDSTKEKFESWTIDYPFEKFYMEESKAQPAEQLYRERNMDSSANVYALVYLLNGKAAIKDVYVNDTSISTLVKLHQK